MAILSVNINKLATLRNSRGKNNPDVIRGAQEIIRFGAQGITVHPRPDERHIRKSDVYQLKSVINVELNVEGFPSEDFLSMIEKVKPAQCTLVPDAPEVLTSNAGWNVKANESFLATVARRLNKAGVRTSVFVDPMNIQVDEYVLLKQIGIERVELFTEHYADSFGSSAASAVLANYKESASRARAAGLGVNAGHDLSAENLPQLIAEIPWIAEVSIGHALICDALYWGLEETVKRYIRAISR